MIGVLELGSQSTRLIEHRLNELGYQVKVSTLMEDLKNCSAIVYSGSHLSTYQGAHLETFKNKPSIFICFAFQWIAEQSGGKVVHGSHSGYAEQKILLKSHASLKLPSQELITWVSHSDSIMSLSSDWETLSDDLPIMIAHHKKLPWLGVQFHPEILHSVNGHKIFESFLTNHHINPDFNVKTHKEQAKEILLSSVKDNGEVLVALSGGVDSSVCAKLCETFLKNKTHLLCIDHGFLREQDFRDLKANFGNHLTLLDESERFFAALDGVEDPEEKRKNIAKCFVESFHKFMAGHPKIKYFVQGTILTDKIESGKTGGQKIKTHHNMLAIPDNLVVVEPLDFLFKHQVRALGKELSMSDEFIFRQPFPGPGLGIRCEAPVTKENITIVRKGEEILYQFLKEKEIYPWQSMFILLNSKAVGVKGDGRVFQHVGVVRMVDSIDGISATAFVMSPDDEKELTLRLANNLPVARILYDKTPKPPGTIEWQ